MRVSELITEAKTNKPFTNDELARIAHVLDGFEAKGRDSIGAKALGFKGEEHEMPGWVMDAIRFSANTPKTKPKHKTMMLSLSQIYAKIKKV